jgi:hypothetical protein
MSIHTLMASIYGIYYTLMQHLSKIDQHISDIT